MMKTCFVLVLCLVFLSAVLCKRDPTRQSIRRKAALKCIRETSVKYSTVKKFQVGDFTDDDEKARCFLKCFGARMGLFDMDDGESYAINEEWIKNYLNDIVQETELIPDIVSKCKTAEKGENTCDYAFNAYNCFYEETRKKPGLIDPSESSLDKITEADIEKVDEIEGADRFKKVEIKEGGEIDKPKLEVIKADGDKKEDDDEYKFGGFGLLEGDEALIIKTEEEIDALFPNQAKFV